MIAYLRKSGIKFDNLLEKYAKIYNHLLSSMEYSDILYQDPFDWKDKIYVNSVDRNIIPYLLLISLSCKYGLESVKSFLESLKKMNKMDFGLYILENSKDIMQEPSYLLLFFSKMPKCLRKKIEKILRNDSKMIEDLVFALQKKGIPIRHPIHVKIAKDLIRIYH